MRISDWSSDVCSSDLTGLVPLSADALAAFGNHKMVAIKTADAMPHVSSIQFTKSAFYSATWDSYTTVARGLFIDNIDNTIVARSRSEEHTSELQSLMRISYAVFCLKKKNKTKNSQDNLNQNQTNTYT